MNDLIFVGVILMAVVAIWLLVSAVLFVTAYTMYSAVIKFKELRDSGEMSQRHWLVRGVRYSILYVGLAADALLNWWFLTVLFWEWPKETLCSSRIQRWVYGGPCRNTRMAWWFAEEWLNPIDKKHITLPTR